MTKRIFWSMALISIINLSICIAAVMGVPDEIIYPLSFVVFFLTLGIAGAISKKIVRPINNIDPNNPGAVKNYDEITPLLHRLSRQDRLITLQTEGLRRRQLEFQTITDNMSEGFLLLDHEGSVISYNPSAAKFLKFLEQKGEGDTARLFASVKEKALAGKNVEDTFSDGGKIYQLLANPASQDGELFGVAIVILDITEKALRDNMRRDFSANVSHELKTPLTSIYGISEMMMSGIVKPEDINRFAQSIHDESGRLITLINDILRLSRLDENSFSETEETVDLHSLATETAERLRPVAEDSSVSVFVLGEKCEISGFPSVLSEMVYNLCDNAIKYNKSEGRVTIRTEMKNGHPVLSVSDTGIGIPKEHLDRVFERFYRVDKSHSKAIGGTGLGLSIVKHGAISHKAEISINSILNQGTTVTVTFPRQNICS